jgi:hypothetical protein
MIILIKHFNKVYFLNRFLFPCGKTFFIDEKTHVIIVCGINAKIDGMGIKE